MVISLFPLNSHIKERKISVSRGIKLRQRQVFIANRTAIEVAESGLERAYLVRRQTQLPYAFIYHTARLLISYRC